MALTLKFEDRMSRLLTCDVQFGEKSGDLAEELVRYGFINRVSPNCGFITRLYSNQPDPCRHMS